MIKMATAYTTYDDEIRLTLTKDEANTLAVMMAFVGGDDKTGPRKHTAAISTTLYNAGIRYSTSKEYQLASKSSSFYFSEYPPVEKFTNGAHYMDANGKVFKFVAATVYSGTSDRWLPVGSSSHVLLSTPKRPLTKLIPEAKPETKTAVTTVAKAPTYDPYVDLSRSYRSYLLGY